MKKTVEVTSVIEVEIDETKFTQEFLDNYSRYFYEIDTLEEHIENLAALSVNDCISLTRYGEFVEGYGLLNEMGIKIRKIDQISEIQD